MNRAPALLFKLLVGIFLLTSVMAAVPTLIDTKLLGRPKGYSGNRPEWNQVKFVFKAYVGAISTEMLRHLDHAERSMNAAWRFHARRADRVTDFVLHLDTDIDGEQTATRLGGSLCGVTSRQQVVLRSASSRASFGRDSRSSLSSSRTMFVCLSRPS